MSAIRQTPHFSPHLLSNCETFFAPKLRFGEDYTPPNDLESEELFAKAAPPPCFSWTTEAKTYRLSKRILSVVIFPLALYTTAHRLIGRLIIPPNATQTATIDPQRAVALHKDGWRMKRLSMDIDGVIIDAMIIGKKNTLSNGKWVLVSNGRSEHYQDKIDHNNDIIKLLPQINGNALFFNYPGIGASTGSFPSRNSIQKAYLCMLQFLEDRENGIGAKEIIGYGISLGGCIQGDAVRKHLFKRDIKYQFIKYKSFSSTAKIIAELITDKILRPVREGRIDPRNNIRPLLKYLVSVFIKLMNWNLNTLKASKQLKVREIIIQTCKKTETSSFKRIYNPNLITHDGVVSQSTALGRKILSERKKQNFPKWFEKKEVRGVTGNHTTQLSESDIAALAKRIVDKSK